MYLIPTLIGLLLLLVVFAAWLMVYSDMRKIHRGESSGEGCAKPETRNGDRSAEPGAAPEPPPAAAVLESSETLNPKPKSEAPADGGGR